MDIVVGLSEEYYISLLNDLRNFKDCERGYHFYILKKNPKKMIPRQNKIYYLRDNKIVGYGVVKGIKLIDDETQCNFKGVLWMHKGWFIVAWALSFWYVEGIPVYIYIKQFGFKYFNLEKVLKGQKEPEFITQKQLQWARDGGLLEKESVRGREAGQILIKDLI